MVPNILTLEPWWLAYFLWPWEKTCLECWDLLTSSKIHATCLEINWIGCMHISIFLIYFFFNFGKLETQTIVITIRREIKKDTSSCTKPWRGFYKRKIKVQNVADFNIMTTALHLKHNSRKAFCSCMGFKTPWIKTFCIKYQYFRN